MEFKPSRYSSNDDWGVGCYGVACDLRWAAAYAMVLLVSQTRCVTEAEAAQADAGASATTFLCNPCSTQGKPRSPANHHQGSNAMHGD